MVGEKQSIERIRQANRTDGQALRDANGSQVREPGQAEPEHPQRYVKTAGPAR